jgi:hypothetical protein
VNRHTLLEEWGQELQFASSCIVCARGKADGKKKVIGKERGKKERIKDLWKKWRLTAFSNPANFLSPQNFGARKI